MKKSLVVRISVLVSVTSVMALALAACSPAATTAPPAATAPAATAAPPATAAAGGPTEVHVKLTEYKVEMDKTSIPAGLVKFTIDNTGTLTHEVVLEMAGDDDKPLELNDTESEAENILPGKSATLEWNIDKAGDYQLACHISEPSDHFKSGMVTTFKVVAP